MGGWQITLLGLTAFGTLVNMFSDKSTKYELSIQMISSSLLHFILYMGGWYK